MAVATVAAVLAAGAGTASAQAYTFTTFGAGTRAHGVNDAGQVVGTSNNSSGWARATLWNGTTAIDLGIGQAFGINASGQVVGQTFSGGAAVAALWSGTAVTDLGPGVANDINASGQVVGQSGGRAVLWNGTTATPLETLPSHSYSVAYGINAIGQVAGETRTLNGGWSTWRATLWNGTTVTDLGPGWANGINASGQVVGQSEGRAVLWNGTTATDLGTLGGPWGQASGINASGQVVGTSNNSSGWARATLWNGTTITDLNSFLSAADVSAGWELEWAYEISDNGMIIGEAYNTLTYQNEAFLLTPVPEPGTYAMLLAGLAMVGAAARRSRTRPRGPQDADPRAAVAAATRSGSRPR